jgi:hypothetical protein
MEATYTVAGRTIRQVREGDAINFVTVSGLAGAVVATLFDGDDFIAFDPFADLEAVFCGEPVIDAAAFAAAGITPETARAAENRRSKMFKITYSNHDCSSSTGSMLRETRELAERTAQLMKECGYQTVIIEV